MTGADSGEDRAMTGGDSGEDRPVSRSDSADEPPDAADPTPDAAEGTSAPEDGAGRAASATESRQRLPSPEHSPEEVVKALIQALTDDSGVAADASTGTESTRSTVTATDQGLRTLFAVAAPRFRTAHGSIDAFARALSTPIYDTLFDAETIERGPIEQDGDSAVQTVLARDDDGDRTYEFELRRQSAGKYEGCWMIESIALVYNGVSPSFRRMPTVAFGDTEIKCDERDVLREVLLRVSGYSPHNDVAQVANCGGNGLCGTCAVEVCGETSDPEPRETTRLGLPPHNGEDGLRLSCQTRIHGDVTVTKHNGLWGQHLDTQVDDEDDPERIDVTQSEFDGRFEYDPAVVDDSVDSSGGVVR